jgi:threonyl-tRNA synthetase
VIPITEKQAEAAETVKERLTRAGIRAEIDLRNEKMGFKIREGQMQKLPYLAVVGEREAARGQVAVRHRKDGDLGAKDLEAFIADLQAEIAERR